MAPLIPRFHLFEILDQTIIPTFIRERVQSCLTLFWLIRVPPLQRSSPATLVADTLRSLLGSKLTDYTYVDFCAGAGGPTPFIEKELNARLAISSSTDLHADSLRTRYPRDANGLTKHGENGTMVSLPVDTSASAKKWVDVVLTDIHPHRPAWAAAAAKSPHLHYVPIPVDATSASPVLLNHVVMSPLAPADAELKLKVRKTFRLFFLAFHHMEDHLARDILRNTLETSDGFGIFELQGRSLGELSMILMLWPLLLLISPFHFWDDPVMMLLTYVVPVVPFIVVYDGLVSCLRTRTGAEIEKLIQECGGDSRDWRIREGSVTHTWPMGQMRWFVGVRD